MQNNSRNVLPVFGGLNNFKKTPKNNTYYGAQNNSSPDSATSSRHSQNTKEARVTANRAKINAKYSTVSGGNNTLTPARKVSSFDSYRRKSPSQSPNIDDNNTNSQLNNPNFYKTPKQQSQRNRINSTSSPTAAINESGFVVVENNPNMITPNINIDESFLESEKRKSKDWRKDTFYVSPEQLSAEPPLVDNALLFQSKQDCNEERRRILRERAAFVSRGERSMVNATSNNNDSTNLIKITKDIDLPGSGSFDNFANSGSTARSKADGEKNTDSSANNKSNSAPEVIILLGSPNQLETLQSASSSMPRTISNRRGAAGGTMPQKMRGSPYERSGLAHGDNNSIFSTSINAGTVSSVESTAQLRGIYNLQLLQHEEEVKRKQQQADLYRTQSSSVQSLAQESKSVQMRYVQEAECEFQAALREVRKIREAEEAERRRKEAEERRIREEAERRERERLAKLDAERRAKEEAERAKLAEAERKRLEAEEKMRREQEAVLLAEQAKLQAEQQKLQAEQQAAANATPIAAPANDPSSSSTAQPPPAPAPAAPAPAVDLSNYQNMMIEKASMRKTGLDELIKSMEPWTSSREPAIRQLRLSTKKAVNTKVGQISAQYAQIRTAQMGLLENLQQCEKLMAEGHGPEVLNWCRMRIGDSLVDQALNVRAGETGRLAWPYGYVAAFMFKKHPDLRDLFYGYIYRECVYAIPHFPPFLADIKEFRKSRNQDDDEPDDSFTIRMIGYLRIFFRSYGFS